MTTPQEPAKRHKQKLRRTKQLAAWREKQPKKAEAPEKTSKPAAKNTKDAATPKAVRAKS